MKTGILAILALIISVSSAGACAKRHPANFAVFKQADVIIRAKITSYEGESVRTPYFAHFNFETVDTLLGPRNVKLWSARWQHSTFTMPETWNGPTDVLVGLKAVVAQDGSAVLEVVQQICGPVSVIEFTRENQQKVFSAILKGGNTTF